MYVLTPARHINLINPVKGSQLKGNTQVVNGKATQSTKWPKALHKFFFAECILSEVTSRLHPLFLSSSDQNKCTWGKCEFRICRSVTIANIMSINFWEGNLFSPSWITITSGKPEQETAHKGERTAELPGVIWIFASLYTLEWPSTLNSILSLHSAELVHFGVRLWLQQITKLLN